MGIEIEHTEFAAADYQRFHERLEDNLAALASLLSTPGFGQSQGSLGAELEIYIIDDQGRPLNRNLEMLEGANDPQLTLELNRYNLEYNLSPYTLDDTPFRRTEEEILRKLSTAEKLAAEFGGRIVATGILPTLRREDFGSDCMTERKRYRALVEQLVSLRGSEFKIDINGQDPLKLQMDDITLEGANTSFQVHYQINPEGYVDTFNAFQLTTPIALAMATNSPTLFGHRLWQETRIPLFKQSIDTRHNDRYSWHHPARVNFGHGWVRNSPLEMFTEAVRLHPVLLPVCSAVSASDLLASGSIPRLEELRLHQSTVWLWNRPIYDDAGGGHLRVEMRSLPAGPSAVDMVANAAFHIGMAEGLKGNIRELMPGLPFAMAEYNFYRAAQHGIQAKLAWPRSNQHGCSELPVAALVEEMLPVAEQGLRSIGIAASEIQIYLGVIERRLSAGTTGSVWQLAALERLEPRSSRTEALGMMLEEYLEYSKANIPVSEWPR